MKMNIYSLRVYGKGTALIIIKANDEEAIEEIEGRLTNEYLEVIKVYRIGGYDSETGRITDRQERLVRDYTKEPVEHARDNANGSRKQVGTTLSAGDGHGDGEATPRRRGGRKPIRKNTGTTGTNED